MPGAITSIEAELAELGVTRDESRAYLALLEHGRLTAREVCQATGITRGRIYDVLGGLVNKGAALEAIGRPRSFEPAPPEALLENLISHRKEELARIEQGAQGLIDELRLQVDIAKGSPTIAEAVHHRPTLVKRLDELVGEARKEILAFARPPFFAGVSTSDYASQFDALRRGVNVRGIYESVLIERDDVVALIEALGAAGERSRHLSSLPTKLFLVDRRVAVLPLSEPRTPEDVTTLIIRHDGVAQMLADAFEYHWERAEEVPPSASKTQAASPA